MKILKKHLSPFISHLSSPKGFSLIQLLIILLMLGAIGYFFFRFFDPLTYIKRTNDLVRKTDLEQIQKALDAYYRDNGAYPPHYIDIDNNPADLLLSYKIRALSGVANWGSEDFRPYISLLPKDKNPKKRYVYFSSPSRQAYYIYASLDWYKDPKACNKGDACKSLYVNNVPENACDNDGEGENYICNYAVTSPNVTP